MLLTMRLFFPNVPVDCTDSTAGIRTRHMDRIASTAMTSRRPSGDLPRTSAGYQVRANSYRYLYLPAMVPLIHKWLCVTDPQLRFSRTSQMEFVGAATMGTTEDTNCTRYKHIVHPTKFWIFAINYIILLLLTRHLLWKEE